MYEMELILTCEWFTLMPLCSSTFVFGIMKFHRIYILFTIEKEREKKELENLLVIRLFDNFDIQVLCQINYNWAHLVLLDIISAWFRADIVEYSAKYALKLARNSYYYFEINRVPFKLSRGAVKRIYPFQLKSVEMWFPTEFYIRFYFYTRTYMLINQPNKLDY